MAYSGIPYQTLLEHLSDSKFEINSDDIEWTPDESWGKDKGDHYLLPLYPTTLSADVFKNRLSIFMEARVYFEYRNGCVGGWISYDIGFSGQSEVWEVFEHTVDFDNKWLTPVQLKKLITKEMNRIIAKIGAIKFEM